MHAVLRWAGVAYLAYLGLRSLVAGSRAPAATSLGSQAAEEGPRPAADAHSGPADRASNVGRASAGSQFRCLRGSYLRGALTNASNPKVGVFYLSLFPQFIPAGASPLSFSLMLTSIHAAESLIWLVAVAGLASKLARLLRRTSPRRWADRISGAAFLAFAARLAAGG